MLSRLRNADRHWLRIRASEQWHFTTALTPEECAARLDQRLTPPTESALKRTGMVGKVSGTAFEFQSTRHRRRLAELVAEGHFSPRDSGTNVEMRVRTKNVAVPLFFLVVVFVVFSVAFAVSRVWWIVPCLIAMIVFPILTLLSNAGIARRLVRFIEETLEADPTGPPLRD